MTNGLLSMVCPPGTACALTSGFGLPEILLWVLSFAVVYGVITKVGIFKGKAAATLVSVAIGFMVLMAVPAGLISVIASMSTGLLVVATAFLVILSLIEVAGVKAIEPYKAEDGSVKYAETHIFKKHGTAMAIVVLIIAAVIFWVSGGAALLGLGVALPTITAGTWLLIIVGAAVLWMLSEK